MSNQAAITFLAVGATIAVGALLVTRTAAATPTSTPEGGPDIIDRPPEPPTTEPPIAPPFPLEPPLITEPTIPPWIDPDTGEIDLSKVPVDGLEPPPDGTKESPVHIVRGDGTDHPWDLASLYTGDPSRWLELCAANPQLPPHPDWGCIYPPAGSQINLPPQWVT